ncbi:polysaccharide biosynthesis C-terminal domain-containing protein [bacterium]|nr:polysaccharide biosynthesis C-terminal domain-containing protein [bacterium]
MNVNIIRSHGRTLLITLIMVSDTVLNIILDYILIYYAQIGMDGAAVATLIS